MEHIITRFVKSGSIIHTDFWRAYNGIVEWEMDYQHRGVNHSEGFISEDGTHTNTIEGTWNGIKIRCFPRSRTRKNVPWVLTEFIWRRKHHGDLYNGLMTTLREVGFVRHENNPPSHTELLEANRIQEVQAAAEEEYEWEFDEDIEDNIDAFPIPTEVVETSPIENDPSLYELLE
ncbi:unnamed protein product [Mucor hiemalis]